MQALGKPDPNTEFATDHPDEVISPKPPFPYKRNECNSLMGLLLLLT